MSKSEVDRAKESEGPGEQLFTIKKWNAVALWSWDVECDTCAICRIQVMGKSKLSNCFSKKEFLTVDL